MNELRMYVEHLFEGRVLTTEMIELKEEIYGNLVARYEDYLAEGMDGAEALEKTKASMTSIDDVLEEGAAAVGQEYPGVTRESEQCQEDADGTAGAESEQDVEPVEKTALVPGVPVPPAEDPADEPARVDDKAKGTGRKALLLGALAVFLVIALIMAVLGATGIVDVNEPEVEIDSSALHVSDGKGGGVGATPEDGVVIKDGDDSIVVDANGGVSYDGEPADDLLLSVVNSPSGDVKPYVDTDLSDAAKVEALVRALPMHEYACDIDTTKGVDTLGLAYRELPETVEGDSVDAALAYNVTALFCALPTVNEIQVTTAERDEPQDETYLVFKRDDVQQRFGVRLDGEMVNEAGWKQIKRDNLYKSRFIDRMVDAAEKAWR